MGAAIVIFGAWQKITHQALADFFLTAGLITEAIIFVVYAFLPPPGSEMHAIAEALPKLPSSHFFFFSFFFFFYSLCTFLFLLFFTFSLFPFLFLEKFLRLPFLLL